MIQLRNTWHRHEWDGDWSDKSDKWTPELKERLGYTDEDDGIFWMDFKDFWKTYYTIWVNHTKVDDQGQSYKFSSK